MQDETDEILDEEEFIEISDEHMSKLTDLEKKYCQIMVYQKPRTKAEALKRAGSDAQGKYLSKMAWEIEQREHVKAYLAHLQRCVVKEAGLEIQEIINNARKAIEMAFQIGKPKDADPHNRLLAEIGGFIKGAGSTPSSTNIKIENSLKGDSLEGDIERLLKITSIPNEEDDS